MTSKPSDMFKGELVENKEVPFENIAYATTDIITSTDQGLIMYGVRSLIEEISNNMNDKREFNRKNLFPEASPMLERITDGVLKSFEEMGILENLGEGNYRAKEMVYIKRGRFKLPNQINE